MLAWCGPLFLEARVIDPSNKALCCGCAVCVLVCPAQCIEMVVDDEGFSYPQVDHSACIGCNRCERVCPFKLDGEDAPVVTAYAARSCDEAVLRASSSGGVFSELCGPVLEDGGVVYGVAMDSDCRGCSFVHAQSAAELAPLRGSKYLQANAQGVYEQVAADLRAGRKVLFSGTPCQANALASYVGNRCEGLTIVDCVCHGVPSPGLWAACVDHLEERRGRRVASVDFRCKEAVWKGRSLGERRSSRQEFFSLGASPYMRMFLKNYCLRPSCYSCRAKRMRCSDLTIADFWGVETVAPKMASELGCSLVIVRTGRGAELLERAGRSVELLEVDYGDAVRRNVPEHASVSRPVERDRFFAEFGEHGYVGVAQRYGRTDIGARAKEAVKDLLRRLGLLELVRAARGKGPARALRFGMLVTYFELKDE